MGNVMKPQDEFGSSFETAKELPETSWKRKAIQAASSQAEPIRKSGGFQGSALPTPVELREKLEAFLLSLGVSDVGFSKPEAEGLELSVYHCGRQSKHESKGLELSGQIFP